MEYPILRNTIVTFASFIFVITVVSAWQAPAQQAPSGNVSAPVNVSSATQLKAGSLQVASLVSEGSVKVGNTPASCISDIAGAIRWTGTAFEGCDGTSWKVFGFGAGGGGGSSACPTLADGSYSITVTSSQLSGYNFYNAALACGGINLLAPQKFTLTINSGVTIGGSGVVISNLANGSSVKIINNGRIIGRGGNGTGSWAIKGGDGGNAITSTVPLTIENANGFIAGGGGGGEAYASTEYGSGGGAGIPFGIRGFGTSYQCIANDGVLDMSNCVPQPVPDPHKDGKDGTEMLGGAGCCTSNTGLCGKGGDLGQPGSYSKTPHLGGGAAGYAVYTNGKGITWVSGNDSVRVKGPTN